MIILQRRFIMHTLKLEVKDTVFDKVMYFLSNLPNSEIKLTVENESYKSPKILNSISIKTKGYRFNREEANAR